MKIYELEAAAKARAYAKGIVSDCAAWNAVMSGIENALEDTRDGTPEFEALAMTSLESVLCYDNECTVEDIAWFKAQGVRW